VKILGDGSERVRSDEILGDGSQRVRVDNKWGKAWRMSVGEGRIILG
jgi:hypothetical protein